MLGIHNAFDFLEVADVEDGNGFNELYFSSGIEEKLVKGDYSKVDFTDHVEEILEFSRDITEST